MKKNKMQVLAVYAHTVINGKDLFAWHRIQTSGGYCYKNACKVLRSKLHRNPLTKHIEVKKIISLTNTPFKPC